MTPVRRALLNGDPPEIVAATLNVPLSDVLEIDLRLAFEARARAALLERIARMPSSRSAAAGPAVKPQPATAPGLRSLEQGGWNAPLKGKETPAHGAARGPASPACEGAVR